MTNLILQAQADGDAVADLDARLLSNCVFATVIGMYRWYRPGRGTSAEELAEACSQFVRYGLRAIPRGRPHAAGTRAPRATEPRRSGRRGTITIAPTNG